ncbi:MAG: DUF5667 domain-containing protein [Nitrospirota bacterium]
MEDNQEQLVLKALGETLKGVQKPKLDEARKLALKSRIQSQLEVPLVKAIQHHGARFSLGAVLRARIKENVFVLIEKTQQKRFIITNFFLFQKKFIAAAMLFFMTFTMFMFMGVSNNVVYASEFTTLDSFEGEVHIERDGEMIELEEDMRLYEKDRIITGADGKATVKFFDDSVSRLSGDTEILIDVLHRPVGSTVISYVEIDLINGNMWSKVLNLVEKKSSFVVQSSDIFTATKKAAFNVSVDNMEVEVDVYKNVVDVVTAHEVETVVSGQKAVLNQENNVEVTKIAKEVKESDWVKENLDTDRVYIAEVGETLLAAKVESSGVNVEDGFDGENSLTESALLFLTFDDVKAIKMQLDLAEKKLIAAEVKLNDANITIEDKVAVEQAISTYSNIVVEYVNFVENVRITDYEYAEELEQYVVDKLLLQKKNLSLVLPDSPSYGIKAAVEDLEVLVANNLNEEMIVKSKQGLSKLSEVEDALEKGDSDLAKQILDGYKKDVDNMIKVIDSIDDEKEGDLKNELLDDVKSGMKLLDEMNTDVKIVTDSEIEDIVVGIGDTTDVSEPVIEADYGVIIEGDKPLSPLLAP